MVYKLTLEINDKYRELVKNLKNNLNKDTNSQLFEFLLNVTHNLISMETSNNFNSNLGKHLEKDAKLLRNRFKAENNKELFEKLIQDAKSKVIKEWSDSEFTM